MYFLFLSIYLPISIYNTRIIHFILLFYFMLSVFLAFYIVILNIISINHDIKASCSNFDWLSKNNSFGDSS